MRHLVLAVISVTTLAACGSNEPPVLGTQRSVTFAPQPAATTSPAGKAFIIDLANGDRATRAELTGLAANTNYVAHYHLQGTPSVAPCASGGNPITGSTMIGTTDASGNLVLRGLASRAELNGATYLNVHTASPAAPGTPVDAGVACASLQ